MVTIFTPTYNRAHLLNRLYESLLKQTSFDFEWLIVDDGSKDNTREVVENFINERKINIRYIYQENRGKYVAFNNGVKHACGDLFFCVDSDDFLPENAVSSILNAPIADKKIAGIAALKVDLNGKILSSSMPDNINQSPVCDLSRMHGFVGELSLVYKTEILKKFTFPEIEGENFMGESVLYDQIDKEYEMLLSNEVLTICEYQQDGLTTNLFRTLLKNPTGYKIYYKQRIDIALNLKERANYMLRYNAFKILSKDKSYNYKGRHKFLTTLFYPLGLLLCVYYKLKK